jgi:hypothetical protein
VLQLSFGDLTNASIACEYRHHRIKTNAQSILLKYGDFMLSNHWLLKSAASCALLLLVGCVATPKHLAFNKDSATPVKRIVVLTMRHSEIDLMIVNNPGYSFGLIGVAVAEANRAPKAHWLKDEVIRDRFDYLNEFKNALTDAMSARGYELRWQDPMQMADGAKDVPRKNFGFRNTYTATTDTDAQLDIDFGFIGYAAAGSSDSAPYRPTIVLSARLIGADGKNVLFEDFIVYNSVFPFLKDPITIEPDEHFRYPEFNALQSAGPDAIKGLQIAFRATADQLAKQF